MRMIARALVMFVCVAVIAAEPSGRRESYNDRYAVLSERNIFLRDRSRPPPSEAPTTRATHPPEQDFVLTGVVYEAEGFRAYIEDLVNSSVVKISVGEGVARGRIASIAIDAVAYEQA